MKLLLIANCIYLPINDSNKYIAGSISGNMFMNEIFTLEEIQAKHKDSTYELEKCNNLHDLTKKLGVR